MMNYYELYPQPYYRPYKCHKGPDGKSKCAWEDPEATEYLSKYKGQYIRTSISGFGVVYAQLTDYDSATGIVDLNVYFTPGRPPQFMRVNRNDLTAIVPLGNQPPPEILAQPTSPTMSTMQPKRCDWVRLSNGQWVWACW